MTKIYIVSKCKFPAGDAISSYFSNIGYELNKQIPVVYIGLGYENEILESGEEIISFRKGTNNNTFSKIKNNTLFEKRITQYIKSNCKPGDVVLIDGVFSGHFYRSISKLLKKKECYANICITEHFGKNQFFPITPGHLVDYCNNKYLYNSLRDKYFNIIGISSHIIDIFKAKGFNVFLLPFTFSIDKNYLIDVKKKEHELINYIYAGNPGKKDLLFEMLKGFSLLEKNDLLKIKIHVVGTNEKWLLKNRGSKPIFEKIKGSIIFYGRKDLQFVQSLFKEMDYSILLRNPNNNSSKGGFPTKISESLFYATTPICNLSSDLGFYLNASNSIIVDGYNSIAFSSAIKHSLNLNKNEITNLNKASRETFEKQLSSNFYSKQLLDFVINKN